MKRTCRVSPIIAAVFIAAGFGAAPAWAGVNPVGWVPGGSLFYAHKLTPGLSVGMGVFFLFRSQHEI